MLIYILKFSACLSIFMVFYKLFLEQSSIHTFKRFYLLSALTLAFIIPSLTIIEYVEPIAFENFEISEPISNFEVIETGPQETVTNYAPIILWSIYGLGAFIFLLKFCINFNRIIIRIKKNPRHKSANFINVLVRNLMVPHTFFNYIFLNKYKFEHAEIPKEVILHEQTHAKQKHSIDILILELLQILFWFNPLIYLLKRDVKLNHEFLADRAVLQNGIQPSAYQKLLLAFSSNASEPQLANAINYSFIKKRFTVMKTKTSKRSVWLRSFLLLPLLAILFYSFTERKQIVKNNSSSIETQSTSSEGVSEALMQEYNAFIIKFNTTHSIDYSKYERIVSIYNLMSDKQKASVEPYPKVPGIDLSKTKAKVPTAEQFESWKNEKKFAIWVDGIHIPNAKLNSYSLNDIAHYVGSFAHKNARSEKFPQPYQFSLYTKKGFENTYQQSKVKEYRAVSKQYSEAIDVFLKGNRTDDSELRLLLERSLRLYESFSKEDIKKFGIKPPPPPPALKSQQQGATPEQIEEYNRLAKQYNKKPVAQRIIKLKDIKYLERLYKVMSSAQKKNAQPFPECPPPPPRPAKSETGNGPNAINSEEVDDILPHSSAVEQQKQNDIGSVKINNETFFYHTENGVTTYYDTYGVKVDPNEKKIMPSNIEDSDPVTGFIKVNGETLYYVTINGNTRYFNRQGFQVSKEGKVLSASQVNATDVLPNLYITKVYNDGEIAVEFKDNLPSNKTDVVDIPSPPAPISSLDFIIDLAKKNTKFFYENESISSDKAIELLKKNPKLNILAKRTKSKRPLVYISKDPISTKKQQKSKEPVQINGKTPTDGLLVLRTSDFKNIKLSLENTEVMSFKFKVPGKPTQSISGNLLDEASKVNAKELSKGGSVQFFDIKDSKGLVHPPVVVKISGKLVGAKGEALPSKQKPK